MNREHILLVDDDEGLLQLLKMRLSAMGFAVTPCTRGEEALDHARKELFDLAITDLRLPDRDGLSVMEELLLIHPALPVLILTAHGSIPNAVEAMQKGAFGYLTKPFDDNELKVHIEKALNQQRMQREIQRLKALVKEQYGLENVVAKSQRMQVLLQQVIQVADTDAIICLLGETGTGKEVLGRVIHCNSKRANGRFVGVNCGAVPESLFESVLFGHVKGAFTGAQDSKMGLFLSANGGTLFLDEIGEIPLSLQVKLLRAIQEREILSIGSTTPTKVDARIIAATNKDLKQAVREGQFREDLYYRINVVTMQIPPLRDRRDDIPSLAQHFLQQAGRRLHKEIRGFHPEALQKLMLYPWPGNVRELENVVEKAVILSTQDHIPAHLIPSVEGPQQAVVQPLSQARAEFERRYLLEILEYAGGNISRAAEIAGRYRADFYKLLKKHGLHSGSAKAGDGSVRTTEPGQHN